VPIELSVHTDGIRVAFPQKLDARQAILKSRYRIEQWNYRWSADYGSKRWSVRQPDRIGQDTLSIDRVTLADDGKSVYLHIKGLTPVMQMRISYDVQTADGKQFAGAIHNTIHRLAPAAKP
jgi:hypothetical protein